MMNDDDFSKAKKVNGSDTCAEKCMWCEKTLWIVALYVEYKNIVLEKSDKMSCDEEGKRRFVLGEMSRHVYGEERSG